jgi:leader peptidase (prepilin peptidase) / N-methyltransferase
MSADPIDIRRIELDADTSVWVPARQPEEAAPDAEPPAQPRRVPRVRPAAAAGAAAAAGVALVVLGPTREGLLAAWTLATLTILAAIDLEVRLLPNRIVFPAMLGAIGWQAVFFPDRFVECLVAGVCAGLVFLLPSLVQPGAIGMGDVKVAALLGFVLGADVVVALLAGSLLSAPVALAMLSINGAAARRAALPFGPFLAIGAAIALLLG